MKKKGKKRLYTRIIEFIEGLEIAQGRHAGKKFKVLPWQRKFIRGAFSQDDDAALTIARGGGKTTLMAGIALATVVGPLMKPNADCIVVASSLEQARLLFRHLTHFANPWVEEDDKRYKLRESNNKIEFEDMETRAKVRLIGSNPNRMHGLSPSLIIGDELASWDVTKIDKALAILETSRGKVEDSKAIWIGTRASSPDHPWQVILDTPLGYKQSHHADKNDDPFDEKVWHKANPSLRHLPDLLKKMRQEAEKARMDASSMASFKSLRLNMGVPETLEDILLDPDVWTEIEIPDAAPEDMSGPYVLGIDLGQTEAMSAASAYFLDSGVLDCFAAFPFSPNLHERGMSDNVGDLYIRMKERNELILAGDRVSDVASLLREVYNRWGKPAAIVCDRYREHELRQNLEKAGFPHTSLVVRGMGFIDGAEDVRGFRSGCLTRRVKPIKSLLLRSAIGGARTVSDPAGNHKLAKGGQGRRTRCRDDAAASSILAIAEALRNNKEQEEDDVGYVIL